MTKTLRSLFFALFVAFTSIQAVAQIATATLLGTVTDSTGAAIPNATVVITQTETNFHQTVTSKPDGSYRAEFLPIGPYSVKVAAEGFKALNREGIILNAAQTAMVDLALQIGDASQTVDVTAEAPLVNSSNATLGRVIDNTEVDNLPLVGRNAYALLNLTPGVQQVSTVNNLGYPEQHTFINGSTDGTVGQVSYYLDGGINMTGLRNTGNILPNPDAIAEFSVQTNNFSAQFGRTSAGIVSVVTKSGSNSVHGSVFDFERNNAFSASTHNAGKTLPLHRHQFGSTIGGPIVQDKTFFFGSYAGLRQTDGHLLTNAVVPDKFQRAGNFSENLPTASGPIASCTQPISDADKKITDHGGRFIVCNRGTNLPYPGNIITDPLDITAQNVLNQNVPLPTNDVSGQWLGSYSTANNNDEFLIKLDHQLTASHRLSLNYFQTNGMSTQLPSGGSIAGWSMQNFNWRQQNANVSDVWTLNGNTVNQIWANYSRMIAGRVNLPAKSLADYGSTFNVQGPMQLPQIDVSGWFRLSQSIAGPLAGDNYYGLRDVLVLTRGKHALHVGAEVSLEKDAQQTLLQDYGVFSFSASPSARTGNAMSDYVLGRPNTMNQDSPVYSNANYWNIGVFAQDDWRIARRLTLNLGLRYDIQTAPTDTMNRTINFRAGVQSTAIPAAPVGMLFPGDPGVPKTGAGTRYNHISPRVGFAWDPYGDGKTIFHGGFGLFFGSIGGNEFEIPSNSQPYAVRASYTKVISMTSPYATDTTDFPGGVSPYPYIYDPAHPRFIKPTQVMAMDPDYKWPYNYQINFGVQHQFTNTLAMSISYVGSLNRKLPLYNDLNYPQYNVASPSSNTTSTANARRPIAGYSNIYVITSNQTSNYNGLQLTVDKRLSAHFSVKSYYTWSKTLASIAMDNNTLGNNFEDYNLPKLDRQRSDYDFRHQSVTSLVIKPDYYAGKNRTLRGVLNGWTVSGIVTLTSGAPFSITTGGDTNGDSNTNDRPNVAAGRIAQLANPGNANRWFDPANFCVFSPTTGACPGTGPVGSDGTVRPNLLDAPGARNIDAALFRDFKVYNRVKFQFRTEVTNVFNLTNLGTPNGTYTSPNFGKITGANGSYPNRQIQLGGRILF